MTHTNRRPSERPISELMTPLPHTVSADQTLADACLRMRALGVRHLPVTDQGRVIGVLSDREANMLFDAPQLELGAMSVGDVITGKPCLVTSDSGFADTLDAMSERKTDCCVVMEGGLTVGILTSIDIMQLMSSMLSARSGPRERGLAASEVRARILAEHVLIRSLLQAAEEHARALVGGEQESDGPLREQARNLYQTLLRHIELENTILAPALREADGFGREREAQLRGEHTQQKVRLHQALAALDDTPALPLAKDVLMLVGDLRADMAYEERALLTEAVLKDDVVEVDSFGG